MRHTLHWMLAGSLLLLGGCADLEKKNLQQGFAKYSARQNAEAEQIADSFIREHPQSEVIDQAYYLRGVARLTRGDRAGAAADLNAALARARTPDVKAKAAKAFCTLGESAIEQFAWAEAQKDYQTALGTGLLARPQVIEANYRIGACMQAQGQWEQAEPCFARASAADADATLRQRALARMHLRNFSLQYGAFQDAAGARDLAAKLKSGGISASVTVDVREGNRIWYLVQSGSYRTWSEASAARTSVLSRFPVAVIVP